MSLFSYKTACRDMPGNRAFAGHVPWMLCSVILLRENGARHNSLPSTTHRYECTPTRNDISSISLHIQLIADPCP